jgi:transposase
MRKKHVVRLTKKQRQTLLGLVSSGRNSARKIVRARILLKADVHGEAWPDGRIAEALEVGTATVERIRRRFAEEGWEAAVGRRPQPARPEKRRLDGEAEAHLVQLACSTAPAGHSRWTLDLLTDRMVRLNYVPSVSRYTVRRVLKKTSLSLG